MTPTDWGHPRRHRLTRAVEFAQVFDHAKRFGSGPLAILVVRNEGALPRLGMVIAKKHIPTAVARNRVKRLIRENFRLHQTQLCGLDVVVIARRGLGELPGQRITETLIKQWVVLERWKNSSSD